jgi:proteasome lid subunit RPN8/RPN11
LILPLATVEETARKLRSVGRLEACCLWLGTRSKDGTERVEAIVVPQQSNRLLNYAVDSAAMQGANAVAKQGGWTLIANVHSHPGENTEHSEYDDAMMPSRKALSIVVPHYGRWSVDNWPQGYGIHEFVDDYWHMLSPKQVNERVQVGEARPLQVCDLR